MINDSKDDRNAVTVNYGISGRI